MSQCNVQEKHLHEDHDDGLDEEGGVEVRAEPVEAFQDGGEEHYERDVEGEARRGACTVDGVDLVRVGGDGCGNEAGACVNISLTGFYTALSICTYKMGAMFSTSIVMRPMVAIWGVLPADATKAKIWQDNGGSGRIKRQ